MTMDAGKITCIYRGAAKPARNKWKSEKHVD